MLEYVKGVICGIWECVDISMVLWGLFLYDCICLGMFLYVWVCLGMFGYVWVCLNKLVYDRLNYLMLWCLLVCFAAC